MTVTTFSVRLGHMSLSLATLLFASFFAGLFGFSLVRGGVCTLAAIEEAVLERRWQRLQAFAELWLWVGAFFLIAYFGFGVQFISASYEVTLASILGGFLLGLGAFINQACPFGTIVAIGSGYWSYLATPLGFFVGCLIHSRHLPFLSPRSIPPASPLLTLSPLILAPIVALIVWRVSPAVSSFTRPEGRSAFLRQAWPPLVASLFVAFSFCALVLLVGGWSYTQLFADLASDKYELMRERLILLATMFIGALIGGLTAKGWSPKPATIKSLVCCFVGGVMMGIGHKLAPGAHDSLTLIGQPLLLPYAWVAMTVIYLTLAAIYFLVILRRGKAL